MLKKSLIKSPLSIGGKQTSPIKSIKITNNFDASYTQKLLDYCAKKLTISTAEYIENILGSDDYYKVLGFALSTELKDTLKTHFVGENSLTVTAKPSSSIRSLNELALFKPKQVLKMLNLVVKENGERVTPLIKSHLAVISERRLEKAKQQEQPSIKIPPTTSAPKPTFYGKRRFTYEQIKKSDARKHIGKNIKIYRKKRLIEGELLKANSTSIKVNNKRFGGSTIMELPLNEINKIEVKTFKPIQ